MKKTLVILMAMTMMMSSLAGCSSTPTDNSSKTSSTPSTPSSTVAPAAVKMERGTWNADTTVFTSKILGVKVTLPEGWTAKTDDEIMALMQIGAEQLSDEQKKNLDLSQVANVYEFAIQNTEGESLMLMAENLKLTSGTTSLTEKDYAQALQTQLAALPNMDYKTGTVDTYTIGGKTFTRMPATLADDAVTQWYLLKKEGDYMVAFICTFGTANQAGYEAILASITAA